MTDKIVLSKRMLVPKSILPPKAIRSRYRIELYNDKMCKDCENFQNGDRGNDLCHTCEGEIARYKLYKEHNSDYWSLPQGDFNSLASVLDRKGIQYKLVDKRKEIPFKYPIKFTGKLFGPNYVDENGYPRTDQVKLVNKWMKIKNGMIRARPRAGKTVVSTKLVCELGQKTVILADRFELLKQFYKTYMGDKTKNRKPMSNIPRLRRETGKEIIRLAMKASDLKNLDDVDILLVNYQKYVRKPELFAQLVNGRFSVLVVDEAHGAGAQGYLRVIANCNVKHRISLTATPRRKDNRHILIQRIMGQVVASSKTISLTPEVVFKHSRFSPPRLYKMWHHALAWISSNIDMQKEIVQQVFKDLRDGHEVIIIPLDRKKQIDKLVKMINHQAKINRMKKKEKWPKNLAIKYYDGVDRDTVLEQVDKPGPTVLIAMRSMIKQGIDFNRPSMLYVYVPMSASTDKETGAPAFEQLSMRVATPYKKPRPMVRVWAHNISFFRSCNAGLFWQEIWPNRQGVGESKYIVSKSTFEHAKLLKQKKNTAANKDTFTW